MAFYVDPAVGVHPPRLDVEGEALDHMRLIAREGPLVIDYFARHYRGGNYGDITVGFPSRPLQPCYLELAPIGGIRVLAHRQLLSVLEAGATVRLAGPWLFRQFTIALARPDLWFEFLDHTGGGDERRIVGAEARPMSSERVWAVALLAAFIVLVVMLGLALLEVFGLLPGT